MTMSPNNKNNDTISSISSDISTNGKSSNIDFDVTLASPMMRDRLSASQLPLSSDSKEETTTTTINRHIFCGLGSSGSSSSPVALAVKTFHSSSLSSLSPSAVRKSPSSSSPKTATATATTRNDLYNTMKDNSVIRRELFKRQQQQQDGVERRADDEEDVDDGGTCTTTTTCDDDYADIGDEVVVVVDKQQQQQQQHVATTVTPTPTTTTLPHDSNNSTPPPPPPRVMCGPLEQQQQPSNNSHHPEVSSCYNNYRLKEEFIDDIVRHMDCTMSHYFDSTVVKNVVSEPMASQFKIRGSQYMTNNIKITSAPSVFSVLGVDHIIRPKRVAASSTLHSSALENSYVKRLRRVCQMRSVVTPFLLIINLNLPWGNLLTYMYRPDAHGDSPFLHPINTPFEKLWHQFLTQPSTRTNTLKLIPHVTKGPWLVKKLVGQQPCIVGRKLPVQYYGYPQNNYLEITMDVTRGNSMANKIASAMSKSADAVTVDLAFVLEGREKEVLPERVLGVYRLHHVCVREWDGDVWEEEVRRRERVRERSRG